MVKGGNIMKQLLLPMLLLTAVAFSKKVTSVQSCRDFQIVRHNINNIELCVSNFGKFGQDETGNAAGMWWPVSSGHSYIYGAGIWFGTIDSIGDTLVTIGYGPSGGQSEFVPGRAGWSVSDPDAIIFLYPQTWPFTPPSRLEDIFPENAKTISQQDSWCCYNDYDTVYHMPGDTRPIGLEVYQTVYAWSYTTLKNAIFLMFEVKNVSEYTIHNCYIGICSDIDIGNEAGAYGNDFLTAIIEQWYVIEGESLWVDDLVYQWQEEIEPGTPPWSPGVIGFDYLQTPWNLVEGADKDEDGILDQYERDSIYFYSNVDPSQWDVDGDDVPDWRDQSQIPQLGMQSFMRFTLDLEPGRDNERYMTMVGYNYLTGVYVQYDTLQTGSDDQRFLMCSGPFDLDPDSSVIVLLGIMLAKWDSLSGKPDTAIVLIDHLCQHIFDMNWLLPGPPPPPTLTCVPGDAQITLIWECVADPTSAAYNPVLAADPYYAVVSDPLKPELYDSFYVEYDFQGYGVWKSLDCQDWTLVTRYDVYDDIMFNDTVTGIYAENTGLMHYYVDTDVRNGFEYYYSVTAFDYNWLKDTYDSVFVIDSIRHAPDSQWVYVYDDTTVTGPCPIWLESGAVGISAYPRRDPANYEPGMINIEILGGNPAIADNNITAAVTYPMQMTDDLFYLDFGPIVYDDGNPLYSAVLTVEDGDTLADVDATLASGDATYAEFGTRNGISISAIFQREDISIGEVFSRIEVDQGTYSDTNLIPDMISTNWAYRGNNFKVYWYAKTPGGRVNTVTVIDDLTNDTIPYKPCNLDTSVATDSIKDGWCFQSSATNPAGAYNVSDTLILSNIPLYGTRYLYVCGGRFTLKKIGQFKPSDSLSLPSENDVWTVYANPDYMPAPANARLQITPTPAAYGTGQVELNVKVTPNPYLIHNEWRQAFNPSRLKFINLPSDCTIRIFNLNGELVKTLKHHHTLIPEQNMQEVLGSAGGDEWWDLLSDNHQLVASGVYIFHVQSDVGEQIGKFVIIR
jgi:hypothetical protein